MHYETFTLTFITFGLLVLLTASIKPVLALDPVFSSWGKTIRGYDQWLISNKASPLKVAENLPTNIKV